MKKINILFLILFMGCNLPINRGVKSLEDLKRVDHHYKEGMKLIALKDYDEAIFYFNNLIKKYKTRKDEKYSSLAIYQIGFCYYKKGHIKKALDYTNKVLYRSRNRRARTLALLLKRKITREYKS